MSERARAFQQWFLDREDAFTGYLRSLVEVETPSDRPDCFEELFDILKSSFEELNFRVEHREGETSAGQLLCLPPDLPPGEPAQLVVGHCDTVWEEGTLGEMPFRIDGNEISGPGVYDMKTGLAMMVFGLRAIRELDGTPALPPVFLITSDEEVGSGDSRALIMEQARRARRTFVLEPSLGIDGRIKTRRKGVGHFEIEITGKASHAGLAPEEGVSAILGLSHIVQQLFKLNDQQRGVSVNVGTIEGGERSNVIAARSRAVVDVRVPNKEEGRRIGEAIYSLEPEIDGVELVITGDINRPPMEKGVANEALWQIACRLGDELGLDLQEGTSGGASDGNFTNQHSPTLDGLGAVGEGAHAWHEKIFLEETLCRAALFSLLLLEPETGEGKGA
ncbi:MAG: M20 family metallopeptidase [Balneolaceae bacterium]|nr:M20 family metallopeptidase [Balneolaceae bacterium]